MAGVDSNRPLQLAFVDLSLQPAHPLSFGVEHRDLVLHLDQRQAGHSLSQQLIEHCLELADDRIEHFGSFAQVRGRLLGGEVVHEHQARGEVRVFLARLAQELAERRGQNLATAVGELVDRSLRPLALLLALDGEDPAVALQHFDRVVERAEVQADELVVMTRAHLGGHLIWMHRLLVQQLQDRKGEWREELGLELGLGHIPNGVYETGYTLPSTQPSIVVADGPWSYAMDRDYPIAQLRAWTGSSSKAWCSAASTASAMPNECARSDSRSTLSSRLTSFEPRGRIRSRTRSTTGACGQSRKR